MQLMSQIHTSMRLPVTHVCALFFGESFPSRPGCLIRSWPQATLLTKWMLEGPLTSVPACWSPWVEIGLMSVMQGPSLISLSDPARLSPGVRLVSTLVIWSLSSQHGHSSPPDQEPDVPAVELMFVILSHAMIVSATPASQFPRCHRNAPSRQERWGPVVMSKCPSVPSCLLK